MTEVERDPKTRIRELVFLIERYGPHEPDLNHRSNLRQLAELEEQYPQEFIEATGANLVSVVRDTYLDRIASGSIQREVLETILSSLADDLAGPAPPPLVRMTVQVIMGSYLDYWLLELHAVEKYGDGRQAIPPEFDRRRTEAHKRLMRSIQTLEKIRPMIAPRFRAMAIRGDVAIMEAG